MRLIFQKQKSDTDQPQTSSIEISPAKSPLLNGIQLIGYHMSPAFPEPWEWGLTNVHTDPHTYKFRGCTDTPHKSESWLSHLRIFFNYSSLDTCLDGTVHPCGKGMGLLQQKPMGFFVPPLHMGSSHLLQFLSLYVYVCACMHLSMYVCVDMHIHVEARGQHWISFLGRCLTGSLNSLELDKASWPARKA